MTIQQLQYVVALDTHRHFVKAAQSCFVTQPTLTLQLKKLEEEISLVLFDRSTKPLEVTPMGQTFVKRAKRIIREIDDLKELVNNDRNEIEGVFTVGIIPTLSPYLLPRFINDFINNHPNTKLVIEELQSEAMIEMMKNKQLDIGILATPLNESEIVETPVFYEPFLVYADSKNSLLQHERISKKHLKPMGLWILRSGHCFRSQTLDICELEAAEHHKNLEVEGGSIETLKKMIDQVSGYTLIPEMSFDQSIEMNKVVRFIDPQPVREISIISHKHFHKIQLIEELKKCILNNTPKSFQKDTSFRRVKWR
ncbi:MAG: LysR substrate-binding domain-containing protein [Bacteroidota bacterium]